MNNGLDNYVNQNKQDKPVSLDDVVSKQLESESKVGVSPYLEGKEVTPAVAPTPVVEEKTQEVVVETKKSNKGFNIIILSIMAIILGTIIYLYFYYYS